MKLLTAFAALLLCSCYQTNYATTSKTARISGKMASFYAWTFQGQSHSFIYKIDGKEVRGTRTFTVDAGKRVIDANFVGGDQPPVPLGNGVVMGGTYTGGKCTFTPVLEPGHRYTVIGGTKADKRKGLLYDVTGGDWKVVASAPMAE